MIKSPLNYVNFYIVQLRTEHFKAAKRACLDILKEQLIMRCILLQPYAYCGSDWVGDPLDRHSTSVYSVFIGSNLISWQYYFSFVYIYIRTLFFFFFFFVRIKISNIILVN